MESHQPRANSCDHQFCLLNKKPSSIHSFGSFSLEVHNEIMACSWNPLGHEVATCSTLKRQEFQDTVSPRDQDPTSVKLVARLVFSNNHRSILHLIGALLFHVQNERTAAG